VELLCDDEMRRSMATITINITRFDLNDHVVMLENAREGEGEMIDIYHGVIGALSVTGIGSWLSISESLPNFT
jgi:hypothetical protein